VVTAASTLVPLFAVLNSQPERAFSPTGATLILQVKSVEKDVDTV